MLSAPILVAYYAAWSIYSRSYFIDQIPAEKITHINYAFANIDNDGNIQLGDPWADVEKAFQNDRWDQQLRGNFNQLILLKQKYPHLKTLISVGGWTWSKRFSDVALNDQSRAKFAKSCVDFIVKYSFDGVDIDWEYPVSGGLPENVRRPEDRQNYVLLLKEIREQLNQINKTYLLTVATGAGPERINDLDVKEMSKYLDWINVMTYDFHAAGGWDSKTGHNAPLYTNDQENLTDVSPSFLKSRYNCNAAIQAYIENGTPRNKLVLGLGLYGRGWKGVFNKERNGFSQPSSPESPMGTWEHGVFDYDHIIKSYLPVSTRYWDEQSKVPFLYNFTNGIWISYDDEQSIQIKSEYIKQEQLAGAMFWELSGDRQYRLIDVTYQTLLKDINLEKKTKDLLMISTTNQNLSQWKINHQYQINDKVIFKKNIYKCILSHRSASGWFPSVVPQLWKKI